MIEVRQIGLDEIPEVIAKMKAFEQASKHVKVTVSHSIETYTRFLKSGIGAVFVLYKNSEAIGALGCIKAPDLHDGTMTAIETFWLVFPEHRGHGMMLFDAFEKWSDEQGCNNNAMIHMADSFPKALSRIYNRKGYELAEYHFIKRKV